MAEYIERYAAITTLLAKLDECKHAEFLFGDEIDTIIRNIPAADVVPVVRCDECVHHDDESPYHYCRKWRKNCPDDSDFFCKYGERKEYSVERENNV